jgi:hypothetical protein
MAYSMKSKKRKETSYIIRPAKIERLPIEQDIIIPETKGFPNKQKKISKYEEKKRIKEVETYLSQKYGGYTSVKTKGGYYLEEDGKLIKEPSTEVISFASKKDYEKYKKETKKQVFDWGNEWEQESVSYIKDGHLYLYYPKRKIPIKN